MTKPRDYVKLGLFVSVGAAVLVAGLVLLLGLRLFEERTPYFLEVDGSVHGLSAGAPVELYGIHIGTVSAIALFPEGAEEAVRVRLGIRPNVPIYSDAIAVLEYEGLGVSGQRYVAIQGGDPKKGRLPPGGTIPTRPSTFDEITGLVSELGVRGNQVLAATSSLARNLNLIAVAMSEAEIVELARQARQILTETDVLVSEMRGLVRENRPALGRALEGTEGLLARATEAADAVRTLAEVLRRTVRANDEELRATMENLQQASRSFVLLGRNLRQNPSQLLFSSPPEARELP